jgi:hypothetical protein
MRSLVFLLLGVSIGGVGGSVAADNPALSRFTFMQVHVINEGKTENYRFFLGRLPHENEAVEMVYVGDDTDHPGEMRFQLRVKE